MAKVFVSYSRKDIEFAKKLTDELQKSDLDFWIDWEGIPPTVDWWREIEKGIEEADVFVFLISPDSARSKICGEEIDTAVKNGKRVIPIVVREIEWEDTPPQLGHLNYIFFSREDDFDTAVGKLLTAIQTDYEWAATHRRLQVKALEWERNQKENGFLLRGKDLQDAEQELAANTSKEPHPTDLQRELVFHSRKAVDRQRRILTAISVVGIIALAALAIFGFYQAGQATSQANIAMTAQADAETAQASAESESRRAISGQLALESKSVLSQYPQRAQLLGLEALQININASETTSSIAEEALRAANARVTGIGLPGLSREVTFLQFTSDNQWLLAASEYSRELLAWHVPEIDTPGYAPLALNLSLENIFFLELSHDDKWLLVGDIYTGEVQAWETGAIDQPGYTPLNLSAKFESLPPDFDGTQEIKIYFANQEKWLVISKITTVWSDLESRYVISETETLIYPISTIKPDVEPIVFQSPIFISDEENIIFEQQEDQTLLWTYASDTLDDFQSVVLAGKYVSRLDSNTILTSSAENGLLLWYLSDGTPQSKNLIGGNDWKEFGIISGYIYGVKEADDKTTAMGILWNIKTGEPVDGVALSEAGFQYISIVYSPDYESDGYIIAMDGSSKILFWDLTRKDFSHPLELNDLKFPSDADISLYFDRQLNAIVAKQNASTAKIFTFYKIEDAGKSPITVNIPILDENLNYWLTYSSQKNWLRVDAGASKGDTHSIVVFLKDMSNTASQDPEHIILESDIPTGPAGFLLEGWYVFTTEEYDDNDIYHLYYQFIDLNDEDITPDLTYELTSPKDVYAAWVFTKDENVTGWLGLDGYEAINVDVLVSEGRLLTRAPIETGTQEDIYATDFEQETDITEHNGIEESPLHIGFEDEVLYGATSQNGKWYAEGSRDGSLRIWNLEEERKYQFDNASSYYSRMSISSDGQWLAAGNGLWALENGLPSGAPTKLGRQIVDAVFSPDGKWLLYFSADGRISLLNLPEFAKTSVLDAISIDMSQISAEFLYFSPDSRWLVAIGDSNALWDLADPHSLPTLMLPEEGHFQDLVFTPDGRYMLGLVAPWKGDSTELFLWEIKGSLSEESHEVGKLILDQASQISQDGYWLITTEGDLWNLRCMMENTPCEPLLMDIGSDEYPYFRFSSDAHYLLYSFNADDYVTSQEQIWDLQDLDAINQGFPKLVFDEPLIYGWARTYWEIRQPATRRIELNLFGRGGGGVDEGGYKVDYGIEYLSPDPATASFQTHTLRGHEEELSNEMVSPSGRFAITISPDSIKLWDLEAVQADPFTQAVNLPIDTAQITEFGFTVDDRWLVVLMNNARLEFHPLRVDDLMAQACRSVGRNFIINEWQRYFLSEPYQKTCENLPVHPSVTAP